MTLLNEYKRWRESTNLPDESAQVASFVAWEFLQWEYAYYNTQLNGLHQIYTAYMYLLLLELESIQDFDQDILP